MTTRDEQAAIELHKQSIAESIVEVKQSIPLGTCGRPHQVLATGVAALLAVELWKLNHPIVPKPMSKRAAATFSAIGGGIALGAAKLLGF